MNASGWKASLATLLARHNAAKCDGRTASSATRSKRADVLYAGFADLRVMGFRLDDVHGFRGVHMRALAQTWEAKGLSASTLQSRISVFRTFAGWIGKIGMIEGSKKYVVSPASVARTTINRRDKSWCANGVDAAAKIEEVHALDARVAAMLELQLTFGLRMLEAAMLRPHVADRGHSLDVSRGVKNGRPRQIEIDSDTKRRALDRAKAIVGSRMESMMDPSLNQAQAKSAYYRVMRKAGITRKHGITSHGLRHQALNDRYAAITGEASPVRGGHAVEDRELDAFARLEVAELAGHARMDISTHYLGSHTTTIGKSD